MSFLPPDRITELVSFAERADQKVRRDLERGYIRGEDDYTSNFTSELRRLIEDESRTGLAASSYLLKTNAERNVGCDATIVIERGGFAKVAIFEAKLVKFANPTNAWDSIQRASKDSHFSSQLQRQTTVDSRFAVFEMFYGVLPLGKQAPHLQSQGSSCVWHSDAVAADKERLTSPGVWSNADLDSMLRTNSVGIGAVLREVCNCTEGAPIAIQTSADALIQDLRNGTKVLHVKSGPRRGVKKVTPRRR